MNSSSQISEAQEIRRLHPLALAAFILSLLGIPLVGVVTGAVAMILAGVALGQVSANPLFKGGKLAVAGLIIGFADVILWVILLGFIAPRTHVAAGNFLEQTTAPSAEALSRAPAPIRDALKANVFLVVEKKRWPAFLSDSSSGSGVVIGRGEGDFLILTNRHVVDPTFDPDAAGDMKSSPVITAYFHDGTSRQAYVWWTGPNGVDLAIVATGSNPHGAQMRQQSELRDVKIGDKVFAVGNPHDLSWTYSEGVISGVRETVRGPLRLKVFQTQTPINQGNSGGGLYAQDGSLIGIITWTKDKAESEGISFALAYDDFLRLFTHEESGAQENRDAAILE
jgi:S1-C subfamily serine protease